MKIRSITAPNPGPFTLEGTRTWLLGGSAVIDPGPAMDSHVDAIRSAVPGLNTVLITHRHADHAPAAVLLKRLTGARIVAPDAVLSDDDVDLRLRGGESIEVEGEALEVIATPGHTREHVCFLTRSGDLFTGDTILGRGTTAIFPPDGDMNDYIHSLMRLRERQPRTIRPAHGPDRDDAVALIDKYIAHRLEREQQILTVLHHTTSTLADLRGTIYPDLAPGLTPAAEAQLTAHLIKLMREGRVEQVGQSFSVSH